MLRLVAGRTAQQVQRCAAASIATRRGFANAVATKGADLDWDELADKVTSDTGKRELQQLRSTYLDIKTRLADMTKDPEPINWAQWKKEVDPEVVDIFKKCYDTLPKPKFENDAVVEAEQKFQELVSEAEQLAAASEKRAKEIKKEIDLIQSEKDRIESITIDELLAEEPESGKEIDQEISKGDFLP